MMQRYEYNCECARMVICPDGDYTKYKDVAALEAENAALREGLAAVALAQEDAQESIYQVSSEHSIYVWYNVNAEQYGVLKQDSFRDHRIVYTAPAACVTNQNAYPRILEGQALQQLPVPEEFLPDVPKQQK